MKFDLSVERERLLDVHLPLARKAKLSEAADDRSLSGHGEGMAWDGIRCLAAGLFDEGREVLTKARTFLLAANDRHERERGYVRGASESPRWHDLGMCTWLLDGIHDQHAFGEYVWWIEIWFEEAGKANSHIEVHLSLPRYLNAGEYETLIARFERASIGIPRTALRAKSLGAMSYVIAKQRLGLAYSADDVATSLDAFLKRNVVAWADKSFFQYIAIWMKIAHWKPGDDATRSLLKCYDYLPGVEPPKYP